MTPSALEISLQLEPTEPISGVLRRSGGPEQRFAGWLELNSMLERLSRGAREADRGTAVDPASRVAPDEAEA